MTYYFRLTEDFIPNSQTARQYLTIIKNDAPILPVATLKYCSQAKNTIYYYSNFSDMDGFA